MDVKMMPFSLYLVPLKSWWGLTPHCKTYCEDTLAAKVNNNLINKDVPLLPEYLLSAALCYL